MPVRITDLHSVSPQPAHYGHCRKEELSYYYIRLRNQKPHIEVPPCNAGVAFLKGGDAWIVEISEEDVVDSVVAPVRKWVEATGGKVKIVRFGSADTNTRCELVAR